MKIKKRKKSSRFRGTHTHGRGFKKKARGSGNKGGVGMAGTGKRADQKKTIVLNLYGNDYFGKDKALRKQQSPKLKVINIRQIIENINSFSNNGSKDAVNIDLKGYKILSESPEKITKKLIIAASSASKSALEKIKEA